MSIKILSDIECHAVHIVAMTVTITFMFFRIYIKSRVLLIKSINFNLFTCSFLHLNFR